MRRAHVAGSFYPAEPGPLLEFLRDRLVPSPSLRQPKAVILPHAGYVYSGETAALVLRQSHVPDRCFLVGPNHRGVGSSFSLYPEGSWETPLGIVPIDRELTSGLLESCPDLCPDAEAHWNEHSLEVEIPLLQYRNPRIKIAPLVIGTLDLDQTRDVADSMGDFFSNQEEILIVCSSDMNHYENDDLTRKKDRYALDAIEALDEKALDKAVKRYFISMCGFVPVYLTLILVKALGAQKATLLDYRTSADGGGGSERVVGYAGFIIE